MGRVHVRLDTEMFCYVFHHIAVILTSLSSAGKRQLPLPLRVFAGSCPAHQSPLPVLLACDGFDGVSREYGEVREHAHALVTWGRATPYVWRAAAQKERFERSVRAELSTECWIILNKV